MAFPAPRLQRNQPGSNVRPYVCTSIRMCVYMHVPHSLFRSRGEDRNCSLEAEGQRVEAPPRACPLLQECRRAFLPAEAAWDSGCCSTGEGKDTASVQGKSRGERTWITRWDLYSGKAQVLREQGCVLLLRLASWFLTKLLLVFCSPSKSSCHIWFQVKTVQSLQLLCVAFVCVLNNRT